MGKFDKQLKYSIRKVSVGAASVAIGAFYLAMGAGVVHAETNTTTDGGVSQSTPSPDPETSQPNSLTSSSYGAEPAQNPDISGKSTELTTPKEKENKETLNAAQPTEASTSANTRSRRVRRDTGDAPAGGTSNTPTGTSTGNNEVLNSALTERKGSTVKPDQPGVNIPKGDESGAHDPNAHLSFDDPDHTATVEDMWKIIQHMPDDFQNNERSYLRNMDTLGDELRFDKTAENPEGVPLQPGEIREISSFGGWTAIMKKDGETGKFAIGMKNKEGYFTGWYTDKDGKRKEGGMLGSNALDEIYVHEQALDRRFKYMLMLAKGRTIANKDDIAQDGSPFKIATENSSGNQDSLAKLPVKEREDILHHAPNIEGFNGIEKTFKAFSTKYGSRLKIDFVTGYISDFWGSKGTYRIVVKAIKKDNSEETVYDHTINRIDGVVENEERYSQGVNLSAVNSVIKSILKGEFDKKVNDIANDKYKAKYPRDRRKDITKLEPLKEEARQELVKKGEVTYELLIDKDKLREDTGKRKNKFKEELNIQEGYTTVANTLNGVLKQIKDTEVQKNSPTWLNAGEKYPDGTVKSKDSDRVYKLLDFILPTAKKIIYHADTDQLELETDPAKVAKHRAELNTRLADKKAALETADEEKKIELKKEISALESAIRSTNAYTYTEARNGSKKAIILGSHMEATSKPDSRVITDTEYEKYRTNELAAGEKDGLSKFTGYFVEKNNVTRSNVLADDKLSEKITEEIGGDEDKLGKGGYFSTGDIPLGKDVVSYKVQVFAENEKRVGVNKQSPRLQYNLPILADFSVIQDTVEPSKELAKRILTKLKEQGKITEDQEKKIKEEIDKGKKTSEVRSAMTGDVTVRYVDTDGNNLPITDADAKKAGEKTDNGYLVRKDVLIGTDYDVNSKKVPYFNATNGKYYALRSVGRGLETSSDALNGSITKKNTVITFVYEERTVPPTGKGVVHFKKQTSETATEALTGYNDITLEGEVGKEFSTDEVNTKITELKNAGYEIVGDTFTSGDKTVDTIEDTEGQIPSQEYTITVKEKVVTVTEPPTPNTPVDPNVPEGPKWPTTGLAKSDLEKEVTRTITYVKKETADGPEIADAKPTVTQTAHFKRSATYNAVTGTITYGNWESTDKELAKVDTPTLTGYVADKASVEKVETNADSTGLDQKVVYTKLGSWVPKVPGVETPTPLPYPNHPTDPTKPGDPTDPNTPNVPVIPYVPGYTPKTPDGNPLVPVDPEHPENGYKVPPIPETPGNDTPITYEANPQKALVKVVKVDGTTETPLTEDNVAIDGKTGDQIPTESVTAKIADLEKRGYVIDNRDEVLNYINTKFDKDKDSTDGDPTQTVTLKVHEKVVTVTEPKNPNDPVDPDKPEGPKWPATGLAESDLEKEVTRTITYVKKETADGPEIADAKPTVTQTAHFKRSATYNAVTGTITYGNWESTDKELAKVDTPTLTGYVADKASVEKVETNADSTGLDQKVVYTKLGSWVPKVPGVETPTPLPYPNHPTDPTKPGDPTDPNTPNVPVIPYVPGYTPKIGETPLEPKVPNDPTQGYIPPAVPTEPGKDTPIEYVADPQKAVVKVFNTTTGTEVELPAEKVSIDNGTTDSAIPTDSVTAKIADLEKRGYIVENKDLLKDQKFDNEKDPTDGDPTQVFKLLVKERTVEVTEPKNPNDPVDPDKPEGPKWPTTGLAKSDLEKEVTRTINYVDEAGNKVSEPSTDKVTFTREAKINVVTGEITYGEWKAVGGDSTFDKVSSPVVKGYILKDPTQKEVAERKGITPTVANQTIEVVYKKLGSWILKVPGVETPTPLPYPNNPTDPTKPGDPTDPNTPNVPVIPYVPGYTPKIGETPLQPKVPNDPTQGYIPPAVPTEPGKDTPIEYVKVPNTPSPEEPVKPTPESNHITIWVDENGKPLKPEKPGTHEPGNIPGYRLITTVTKDGVTIHKFEKITPVEPNNPVPQKPTTPIPTSQDPTIPTPESQIPTPNTPEANTPTSETNRREELPNTGTEANATLASAGIMTLLAGLGLGFFKKKEEDEK